MSTPFRFAVPLALTFGLLGCGGGPGTSEVGGSGANSSSGGSSGITLMLGGTTGMSVGGASNGTGGDTPANQVIAQLPAGYTQTDIGGYQLGAAVVAGAGAPGMSGGGSGGGAMSGNCGNILLGVSRDFKGADEPMGQPDFNAAISGSDVTPNLVSTTLGTDQKPVYTSKCEIGNAMPAPTCPFGPQTTSQANFDQWYHDTPGVNAPYLVSIYLAPQPGGLFTFQSLHYFPMDGAGFMGMGAANDGKPHNFGFTTELHTQFLYSGGETFNFQGDDDVWVFINNKLAVDLGGLHPAQLRNVQLDASAAMLGIQTGTIYPLDLFHAERHTDASTFRIDTNLSFVDCGTVIPSVVK
jgi:fibro-slime domain-containing protein